MRVFARSTGRAPAVAGFLLLSVAVHLAVLRGAGLWPGSAAPSPTSAAVAVSLIAPPPTPPQAAPVKPVAETRPAVPAARRRPASRLAGRAPPAASPAAGPTAAARFGAFGAAMDAGEPEGLDREAAQPGDDAAGSAAGVTESTQRPSAAGADGADQWGSGGAGGADAAASEAAPAPVAEAPVAVTPQAGSVRYRVHYGEPADDNVVAILEQSFEIGPDAYRLHSEGRARGLMSWFYRGTLVQDSVGGVTAAGLAPNRYSERRGDRAPRSVSIDADRREALFGADVRRAVPPGVQDRLSAVVQLALLRQSRPALFERGATVELPMLGNSRVESVGWRVLGEETVATDAGPVAALRLSRAMVDADEPAIEVWLALDARIVPVRMRITEPNGRALDQVIASQ